MTREPLAIITAAVTSVNVTIQAIVAFGWDITAEQNLAVTGVVSALAGLATVLLVRPKVSPVDSDGIVIPPSDEI